MAWIEQKMRSGGGTSASVRWRLSGSRTGPMQTETFGAGSDDQNLARAEGFVPMVKAAGQEWPDGWVKGEGFVRAHSTADPLTPPPAVAEIGEEYAPLPHIQARLGHGSITTTIDTYGHLLPVGDELISEIIDTALRGQEIRPAPVIRLVTASKT